MPEALDEALSRALKPIPADRFAIADEFSRSLRYATKPPAVRLLPRLIALVITAGAIAAIAAWILGRGPQVAVRPRVVVEIFENRTGDPRHDALGFMAADWITEGFQRTAAVDVVPTLTALAATRYVRDHAASGDPIRALARETGANLVVSGTIYQDEDTLVLQAQLADVQAGRLVGAVEPLRVTQAQSAQALQQLRARLMGLLALTIDDRAIQAERPPTYVAYQAFSEGMDAYVRNDYPLALAAFGRAYALDTTFVLALLYSAFCHTNRRDYARADSVLRIAARQGDRLNEHDRHWFEYQSAELAGDRIRAVAAIRRAAESAPASKASYNFAVAAFEARQPFPAESALRRLSPNVGAMRGWFDYWDLLTSALHAQGKFRQELGVAREARRRFPGRMAAYALEARALAARRKPAELVQLWSVASGKREVAATEIAALAQDVGSELWAHGDSARAKEWFERAYATYTSADTSTTAIDARWGRMQAAALGGRLREAWALGEALVIKDPATRDSYLGLLGIVAARLGNRPRAQLLLDQLAGDRRPYTFGGPQFHAARIAAELRDTARATALLTSALRSGYPYDVEVHRDRALARLKGLSIYRQFDAGRD